MTHAELVKRSSEWLKDQGCPIVISNCSPYAGESPDVIGFFDGGISILIECKTSRMDIAADKKKLYRRVQKNGMGDYRYLALTENIYREDTDSEIYGDWGLIIFSETSCRVLLRSRKMKSRKDIEVSLMVNSIRNNSIPVHYSNKNIKIHSNKISFYDGKRSYPKYDYYTAQEKAERRMMYKDFIEKQERERLEFEMQTAKEEQAIRDRICSEKEFIDNYDRDYPQPDGKFRSVSVHF